MEGNSFGVHGIIASTLAGEGLRTGTKQCDLDKYISIYIYIYIHVIHNNSKTHKVKCYKLVVRGNMFQPHCGHRRANLYKSSAFNVRTIWDPIVCTVILYVE